MKRYCLTINQLIPLSHGENRKVAKFEFYAENMEAAEKFKEDLLNTYQKSTAFRPSPREEILVELSDEII